MYLYDVLFTNVTFLDKTKQEDPQFWPISG